MRYQIALNRTRRTTLDRARSTTSTSRTTFRGATPTRGCPRTCVAVSQKRWLTCSRTCSSKKATNNKSDKSNQSPLALHFFQFSTKLYLSIFVSHDQTTKNVTILITAHTVTEHKFLSPHNCASLTLALKSPALFYYLCPPLTMTVQKVQVKYELFADLNQTFQLHIN